MRLRGIFREYRSSSETYTYPDATASISEEGVTQIGNLHSCQFVVRDGAGAVVTSFPMSISSKYEEAERIESLLFNEAQYHMLREMSLEI